MTVKIMIEYGKKDNWCHECRVLYAENGAAIERRIENVLQNLKADGFDHVRLIDCFNLEFPDMFQRN
ncbi:MAG: hypothetical protein NC453_24600 [Muribaculum sp.]|nr:hypothetical protein [Muribaculum sp.]